MVARAAVRDFQPLLRQGSAKSAIFRADKPHMKPVNLTPPLVDAAWQGQGAPEKPSQQAVSKEVTGVLSMHRQGGTAIDRVHTMFNRYLAGWASDVLILRRRGDSFTWTGSQPSEPADAFTAFHAAA